MDPNACIERIMNTMDTDGREEAIQDLRDWINAGGFAPELPGRCVFPVPPVCTAQWDNTSWVNYWLASGGAAS